ncbi:glycoside hydrolase family 5 protein [Arachidicoccus soli]|uniref:Glycoside hydrolase family 5 protein n=1 Tax=Arachidicoccus soli TaxID=2341117 RepID=A0A386HP53_9BACT|nr:glycoside hydrolase family 5 protein [Arachidicoccus soli]AYD47084.1 glycoside hydrolase family 5 protein [Arachidicoccus soli]
MRKIFLFTFLLWLSQSFAQTPVKRYGFLNVEGTQLVGANGHLVVLHGVSFGWHNFWPRFYNPKAVEWLAKDWGVSVVRAAIGVEPENGYIDNPRFAIKKAEAVIKGAIQSGIYVIVDWHSHNINLDSAKQFFSLIAKKYHQYPNIIYELFNEPDYESWTEVKNYAEQLIPIIRKYDKRNIILVGCPHWDQDINLPAADPIQNVNNIMYTVHFYAATHKEWLRQRCDSALAKGLPIFISESAGMEASGDGKVDMPEWEKWLDWAQKKGISWVVWSISDKNETCSMLKKFAKSNGGWKQNDLKESGIDTKELLKKY